MNDRTQDWMRLAHLAEVGVLSASLIHELRQPLFALKALAQLARHHDAPLAGEELAQLLEHVRQMEELLDHYAGYGRLMETPAVYDLNEPVRGALEMLAHRCRQVGADLDARLCARPLQVQGRPSAARQVVVNLLQNAFDAVEGRARREVVVRSENGGGQARLIVQDSGPGVPEALRARILEPFVTTKPPGRGTGLGLYITRRLVEEASGRLDLAFPEGGGTRVEVWWPVSS